MLIQSSTQNLHSHQLLGRLAADLASQVVQLIVLLHFELTRVVVEVYHHVENLRSEVGLPELPVQRLGFWLVQLKVDDVAAHQHQPLLEEQFGEQCHHEVRRSPRPMLFVVLQVREQLHST